MVLSSHSPSARRSLSLARLGPLVNPLRRRPVFPVTPICLASPPAISCTRRSSRAWPGTAARRGQTPGARRATAARTARAGVAPSCDPVARGSKMDCTYCAIVGPSKGGVYPGQRLGTRPVLEEGATQENTPPGQRMKGCGAGGLYMKQGARRRPPTTNKPLQPLCMLSSTVFKRKGCER